MADPTLDDAKALIERTKACKSAGCEKCATLTYSPYNISPQFVKPENPGEPHAVGLTDEAIADGWAMRVDRPGFIKLCEECRARGLFPWANKLDPEKVLAHMKLRAEQNTVWWLGELESTL